MTAFAGSKATSWAVAIAVSGGIAAPLVRGGVTWVDDVGVAAEQADREGKLLLVLQFPEPASVRPADAPSARLYDAMAFSDPDVTSRFTQRFVFARQTVGDPAEIRAARTGQESPDELPTRNVVTYLCTADGQVVHLLVGFVSAARLDHELSWAHDAYLAARDAAGGEEPALRDAHLKRVPQELIIAFQNQSPRRWPDGMARRDVTVDDVREIVVAVAQLRRFRIAQRFGAAASPALKPRLVSLAAHGDVEPDAVHLLLSEIPLLDIRQMARPVFEQFTGQTFWQVELEVHGIVQWYHARINGDRPFLLVVLRDSSIDSVAEDGRAIVWPPKSIAVRQRLPRFEVLELTENSLKGFVVEAGLEPIKLTTHNPLRFLILDRHGRRVAEITARDRPARLARLMQKALVEDVP